MNNNNGGKKITQDTHQFIRKAWSRTQIAWPVFQSVTHFPLPPTFQYVIETAV